MLRGSGNRGEASGTRMRPLQLLSVPYATLIYPSSLAPSLSFPIFAQKLTKTQPQSTSTDPKSPTRLDAYRRTLKTGGLALNLQYLVGQRKMGNQNAALPHPHTTQQIQELCDIINRPYDTPSGLSFDPRQPGMEFHYTQMDQEPAYPLHDTRVSLEGLESDHPSSPTPQRTPSSYASFEDSQLRVLQKNQSQKRGPQKVKKIKKTDKKKERRGKVTPVTEESRPEETLGDSIRDQNNCKSYHKIVKNYLISKGKGGLLESYENQYHTRYYFICALIFIRHYLDSDFTDTYRSLVDDEIQSQQRKVERKQQQVARLDEKLKSAGEAERTQIAERRCRLLKQMEHIKVVKYEIEDYSVRSCAAFFQGELEESLKILYLKNDPVMRKKYYYLDALQRVTDLQSLVRKHPSHA